MIEVSHLVKRYGEKTAVDDISFVIGTGEVVGFLGPNGAGKSTTMNILTGYLSATSGKVKIAGEDIRENPIAAKRHISYLPELPPLYLDMTVNEQLGFACALRGVKGGKAELSRYIGGICERVRVSDVRGRMIRNLSKGYRQRIGLAQALVGDPEVLVLDEPTVGLDPQQIIDFRSLICELGRTHTVILSSHILSEISAVCKRVLVLNKGRIVADGQPESFQNASGGRLLARVAGPGDEVLTLLKSLPGVVTCEPVQSPEKGSADFLLECAPGSDVRPALFRALARRDWPLLMLKSRELSLEEIYLRLTRDGAAGQETDGGAGT